MELYLQFAYGMKKISIDLSRDWGGATAILSPRDIKPVQLANWKASFQKAGIEPLFDPQCYFPRSKHDGLMMYNYWDSHMLTKADAGESYEDTLTQKILAYNDIAETKKYIIPASMREYEADWHKQWVRNCEKCIESTHKYVNNREIYLTLALPSGLLSQKEDEVEKVIESCEGFNVDGFYIIAQPPNDKYLVDEPLWLSNLIQLCAGLKLSGKKVIMGYGNHQMLCLSAAGIDALATGTYLNVRRFTNKFEKNETMKRKSTWYYYPAALSEYKLSFLDTAYNNDVLEQMKPTGEMDNGYVDILFAGAMPSSTAFTETMAFKHYIHCMKIQAKALSKATYEDTKTANEVLLETATRRIEYMEKNGVYSQRERDFADIVDVNHSALQRLDKIRGTQLKYEWNN